MSSTEHIVKINNGKFILFNMYNRDGLIKDKKIIETQLYKDRIQEMMKDNECETIEELKDLYEEGFDDKWDNFIINEKIYGMLEENLLMFNPRLEKNGKMYFFEDECLYF